MNSTEALARAADANIREHEAHMESLSAPHIRRRMATLAYPPLVPLAPAVAASTRAFTDLLPKHVQLAAERALYPRPVQQKMARTGLGLVDTIDHTISGAQSVRETLLIRRMDGTRRKSQQTAEQLQRISHSREAVTSVREHPYFAGMVQSSSPAVRPIASASSTTPRVSALLHSSFFTSDYTHAFEDSALPLNQRMELDKSRQMEGYKAELQAQLQQARKAGVQVEKQLSAQERKLLAAVRRSSSSNTDHHHKRRRGKKPYRFNSEESDDEEDENTGTKFLQNIRQEVEMQQQQQQSSRQASCVPATAPAALAPAQQRPSTSPAIGVSSLPRTQVPSSSSLLLPPRVGSSKGPRVKARLLVRPPNPAAVAELAKLHASNLKRETKRGGAQAIAIANICQQQAAAEEAEGEQQQQQQEEKKQEEESSRATSPVRPATTPAAGFGQTAANLAALEHMALSALRPHTSAVFSTAASSSSFSPRRPDTSPSGARAGISPRHVSVGGSSTTRAPSTARRRAMASSTTSPFALSLSSWMSVHGKLRKSAGVVSEAQVARCSLLFSLLDANGDGVISLGELANALEQLDIAVDMDKLKESLKEFANKREGHITSVQTTQTKRAEGGQSFFTTRVLTIFVLALSLSFSLTQFRSISSRFQFDFHLGFSPRSFIA